MSTRPDKFSAVTAFRAAHGRFPTIEEATATLRRHRKVTRQIVKLDKLAADTRGNEHERAVAAAMAAKLRR
jgi:hypothetical protein